MTTDSSLVAAKPDPYRVPVDARWLGLDKRALRPALFVLAVVVLLAGVLPAIDNSISWTDETKAGDVINLGDGLTFVPPTGWALTQGFRTSDRPGVPPSATEGNAVLANNGAQIVVQSGEFDGSADALVDRLNDNLRKSDGSGFRVTGDPASITTADGRTGVTEQYTNSAHDGQLAAFVIPSGDLMNVRTRIGLTFKITGPNNGLSSVRADVQTMLRSVATSSS
ncbi:hypothetical protein [uncultured Jatrophihabitans sp.]|uniref:hypothetical protein n=1 Tax=uncultured Jatrophihabitans sp. TaxID=1610747 RepID=UPI0035CA1101